MNTSFDENFLKNLLNRLEIKENLSSENTARQPVHVVYGGADKFKFDISAKLGKIALKTIELHADNYQKFFDVLDIPHTTASEQIYNRIIDKLKSEPVEDFRIDFEDGYGIRKNDEEDLSAETAARETAKAFKEKTLPPFFGFRIKPLTDDFKERAVRTFDIFLTTLLKETNGKLPDNFLITLPKITHPKQVSVFVELLNNFEKIHSLPEGFIKFEMMIESPEVILNKKGECTIPSLIEASQGRCFAAHFGVYDYTSALGISASHQSLEHPAAVFARDIMQIAFADSGIFLSDGATNILPVPHFKKDNLTEEEKRINREKIFNAWRIAFKDINNSLKSGFYQGWDLHPAQLPVRYAAVYSFFHNEFESSAKRLKGFIDKAAQVSLSGTTFDDAASAQALLNFFIRGYNCGAFNEDDIKKTGLSLEELKTKSFLKILELRQER